MRILTGTVLLGGSLAVATLAIAQRPRPGDEPGARSDDDLVTRMMAFDSNKDGKLTKSEVTDDRLHRLFDRSDANKDGTVTKEELAALAAKEQSDDRGGPPGFGPPGGGRPPGFGPPGGGPGRMMMGFPRLGDILPPFVQQRLRLTAKQKTELAALQKEIDTKLDKILSAEQRMELKEMRERGPGGFGPRGRSGRPGGGPPGGFGPGGGGPPGGGPPDGDGQPPPPPDGPQ